MLSDQNKGLEEAEIALDTLHGISSDMYDELSRQEK
jgi:hypothetical protein